MTFTQATALTRVNATTWSGEIAPGWDILGNTNGGYLLAIAANAGLLTSGRSDPVTVTGHFLKSATPGPVTVETEMLKSGRQFATVRSTLRNADGEALVAVLGTYGELEPTDTPERIDATLPSVAPIDECIRLEPTETFPPPFMAKVDLRFHPQDIPLQPGGPTGNPLVRGWFRWPEGEHLDTLGLLVATDAFPPTIFNTDLPVAWTPTIELTTHVRERPKPTEWLRCAFTSRFITGGFVEEDGELWSESGRLIAQSRQLALLPRR